MVRKLVLLLCIVPAFGYITYIATRLPLQGFRAAPGAPWPYPKEWKNSTTVYTMNPKTFRMTGNMMSCHIVSDAIKRYLKLIFIDKESQVDALLKEISSLSVMINDQTCYKYPDENMNESYTLFVTQNPVIKSETVWGALRGLETFSQLVYADENKKYRINNTEITDEPRFGHRGLMLDTSRHFIPMSILLKNLDAMAYNKMNVFHWHIVDDQSFPYESVTFPNLSRLGAYSPRHIYSEGGVKTVLDYARKRGIRVIPEFDTPGHTKSWGRAFPEFLTPCWVNGQPGKAVYKKHGDYEIVNPILNTTYELLHDLLEEVTKVFPDKFVHLGMDEVYHYCWESNPNISEFMKEHGFEDNYDALEEYYTRRVLTIAKTINMKYIIWQDPIERDIEAQKDAIIQVWKDTKLWPEQFYSWQAYIKNVTDKGYSTLLSSCWYLNKISYGADWEQYYRCEPLNFNGTDENYRKVIGGEACMWVEYVDGTNLLSRLWPRASAVAERLWSPREITDVNSAAFRLDQQRCRMVRRGIPAEPILDGYCDYEEGFRDDESNTNNEISVSVSLHSNNLSITLLLFIFAGAMI